MFDRFIDPVNPGAYLASQYHHAHEQDNYSDVVHIFLPNIVNMMRFAGSISFTQLAKTLFHFLKER
ncbi:MAG TPA: hypothetical protein PLP93_06725 [Nitrosomonas sp.]|nr:hypothetical protein [Nitrosomonas sp.]